MPCMRLLLRPPLPTHYQLELYYRIYLIYHIYPVCLSIYLPYLSILSIYPLYLSITSIYQFCLSIYHIYRFYSLSHCVMLCFWTLYGLLTPSRAWLGSQAKLYSRKDTIPNDRPNTFSRHIQGVVKKRVFQLLGHVASRGMALNLQKKSEMKNLEFVGKLPVNGQTVIESIPRRA